MTAPPAWVYLIVGLLGGGGFVRLILGMLERPKLAAEAEAIRVSTLDQALQSLSRRVDELTKEVGRLEGRLDRTEQERDWWRDRSHQLESYIRDVANLPVPHPVSLKESD